MTLDNKQMIFVDYFNNGDGTFTKSAKVIFQGYRKDGGYVEPKTYGRKWIVNSYEISELYDSEIDSYFKEVERKYNESRKKRITTKTYL